MDPTRWPVARALFAQWHRNRSDLKTPAARDFSRPWEALLEAAGLVSATDRKEAQRDARVLAAAGWVELKSPRYRTDWIDRIVLPRAAEERWRQAFDEGPPEADEAQKIAAFAWHPHLEFVRTLRTGLPFEDLRQLNAYFTESRSERAVVPIKERSLEIFGDEKRLDALAESALFREGRLSLAQLHCRIVPEPLGWRRGRHPSGPVIVLENAATWDSYARWDQQVRAFSAIVYGGGLRFVDGVVFLQEIFAELGGPKRVVYFGDLDVAGLRIPTRAHAVAQRSGLPPIEAHAQSYRWLLESVAQRPAERAEETESLGELCAWLGDVGPAAAALLSRGERLAQERIGMEFLSQQRLKAAGFEQAVF